METALTPGHRLDQLRVEGVGGRGGRYLRAHRIGADSGVEYGGIRDQGLGALVGEHGGAIEARHRAVGADLEHLGLGGLNEQAADKHRHGQQHGLTGEN